MKVTEYNFRNNAIQWQMKGIYKCLPQFFALFLTVSDILLFNFFLIFERSSQGAQVSLWHQLKANFIIYKWLTHIYALALIASEILAF